MASPRPANGGAAHRGVRRPIETMPGTRPRGLLELLELMRRRDFTGFSYIPHRRFTPLRESEGTTERTAARVLVSPSLTSSHGARAPSPLSHSSAPAPEAGSELRSAPAATPPGLVRGEVRDRARAEAAAPPRAWPRYAYSTVVVMSMLSRTVRATGQYSAWKPRTRSTVSQSLSETPANVYVTWMRLMTRTFPSFSTSPTPVAVRVPPLALILRASSAPPKVPVSQPTAAAIT